MSDRVEFECLVDALVLLSTENSRHMTQRLFFLKQDGNVRYKTFSTSLL